MCVAITKRRWHLSCGRAGLLLMCNANMLTQTVLIFEFLLTMFTLTRRLFSMLCSYMPPQIDRSYCQFTELALRPFTRLSIYLAKVQLNICVGQHGSTLTTNQNKTGNEIKDTKIQIKSERKFNVKAKYIEPNDSTNENVLKKKVDFGYIPVAGPCPDRKSCRLASGVGVPDENRRPKTI